ncbi:hypothetical protein DB346_24965 [Verrucomicrobia bacterium LW23]|nr:hypothetical protein DB346_24965 [Verrucomicrobia bacterium LW23]
MQEEPIFEHPRFRAALAELQFAVVWTTPPADMFFRFDKGSGERFTSVMKALAVESGYSEIANAPVIPLGHSAAGSYPWNFAAWAPERTAAIISVSGQWPYYVDQNTPPWEGRNVDNVPGLVCVGEFEGADWRADIGLRQRAEHPQTALSMFAEPGAGHFDVSEEKVEYLALYLKKAAQYRLPDTVSGDGSVKLRAVDPTRQGWLVQRWRRGLAPTAQPGPVGQYKGDPKEAFWYFDEEHAAATERIHAFYRGRKPQRVGYVQDGENVPTDPKSHFGTALRFLPQSDGISFKVTGAFLQSATDGTPLGHATGGGPVVISRVCGPMVQTGPDTWSIRFNRVGTDNEKRARDFAFMASHPGDGEYSRAVQQGYLRIPLRNTQGADQSITFPAIADQTVGAAPVTLAATSSSGQPVYYYVREGPAEIEGNKLRLTALPPRSRFPVRVTVVAWQWGRATEPLLKTAPPQERTFLVQK